jgi:hypothetical protein
MNPIKTLVKTLYRFVRLIYLPLLMVLQPTGIPRARLVTSFTGLIVLFLLFPFAATRFGGDVGLAVLGAGVGLAYLFALWGDEFEAD